MPDKKSLIPVLLLALVASILAACRTAPSPEPGPAPRAAVAAANPYAVEAGLAVLRRGGSAVDAAVAMQAVLGLVEPQSSGLGGGAFMLYYDVATATVTAFDGRETAPAGARPDMFLKEDGQPLPFVDAVLSGRSTGVPGAVAMLGAAHARFGRLPWRGLFDQAIALAADGFQAPPRLGRFVNSAWPQAKLPDVRQLFSHADGTPIQAGEEITNPAYAETLRQIAAHGPRTLLRPPFSTGIIARTHQPPRPGTLQQADFDAYQPRVARAVCGPFRLYVVCVPPPPSSGVSLLQLLAILDHTDIAGRGPTDPQAWYLFAEASRLMYADRDHFVADPDFVEVPVAGLLDPQYVAGRAALIADRAGPPPLPGEPAGQQRGADSTLEPGGTSHFVIIDAAGNVVSMTTSVESACGSGRLVEGFCLNNQLTDFSFRPTRDDLPVANAVAGGKRPRSSMSPVIVLDRQGHLVAALGSPGGSAILAYNAKALVGLLAWHLPMQEAFDEPNLIAWGNLFVGEVAKFPPDVIDGLAARGITLQPTRGEPSGLHGLAVRNDGSFDGGADRRRDGIWRTLQIEPGR